MVSEAVSTTPQYWVHCYNVKAIEHLHSEKKRVSWTDSNASVLKLFKKNKNKSMHILP